MSEKLLTMHPFESVLVSTLEAENARLRTTIGDALECFDCDDYAGAFELLRAALLPSVSGEKKGGE